MLMNKQTLPSNNPSKAENLNNIGVLYVKQGNYEEALKYLNESLNMNKQFFPSNRNYSKIGKVIDYIGSAYYYQGKYEEALNYYDQSLEIKKRLYPFYHSSIADTIGNIGSVYVKQGNYEEALKYYNQSLEIFTKILPSNHPKIEKTKKKLKLANENLNVPISQRK